MYRNGPIKRKGESLIDGEGKRLKEGNQSLGDVGADNNAAMPDTSGCDYSAKKGKRKEIIGEVKRDDNGKEFQGYSMYVEVLQDDLDKYMICPSGAMQTTTSCLEDLVSKVLVVFNKWVV
ncbi:hypothetical protein LWI28_025609 [Acer negundo]|uniref:Uncharacterized protein n=1 Tax=Acer negundo TaxID=4023 RepID=A0AAD5J7Z0_ACENE|nr:hypothetical protein LWI28_025609 [Acer negundo]